MGDELTMSLETTPCPFCRQPVEMGLAKCPHCGKELGQTTVIAQRLTPEMLVGRLGDYLLEGGMITQAELERALEYQQQVAKERNLLLGQALLELGLIDRDTLDRAITAQISSFHNALQETNRQLEKRVLERTQDLELRLLQIHTTAEITQNSISATSLSELLRRTVELIVTRLGYSYAAFFLVDDSGQFALLSEASGSAGKAMVARGFQVEAGAPSMTGWVLAHKKSRAAVDITAETDLAKDQYLPETKSEAGIPVAIGEKLLGILDIQHTQIGTFDADAVASLQTIANNIASVIYNFRLLETAQGNLSELTAFFNASHQMTRVNTVVDVIRITNSTLKTSLYLTAFFMAERGGLRLVSLQEKQMTGWGMPLKLPAYPELLPLKTADLEQLACLEAGYKIVHLAPDAPQPEGVPEALLAAPRQAGYKSLAFIPGCRAGKVETLILLCSRRSGALIPEMLRPYTNLADMTTTALEKVNTSQRLEKRLAALETLNIISQVVSVETDLMELYKVIHREVTDVIGDVSFAIATYDPINDTITIPYMFDGTDITRVEPFPLGQGLTSILIRTKQPLMMVEDTERKTRELGAILIGKPAKSWLGVPLLVSGEAIGAILLQDVEQEGRFDEDDQRLLETMASQVAVAIRNAHLLDNISRQATRGRLLYEITNEIRSAPDIPSILEITARELGNVLGSHQARIELGIELPSTESTDLQMVTEEITEQGDSQSPTQAAGAEA